MHWILDGGIFGILTNGIGLLCLALNIARLARRPVSDRAIGAFVGAGLLIAVAGTAVGLHQAAAVLTDPGLDPVEAARRWRMAWGIAPLPVATGSLWGALNLALLGWRR